MSVEAAGSEQFLLAKEGFIRVAAEADANKVRGGERKRGQTRGTCSPADDRGFAGALHSRAHPPPAAAAPNVRVRPRGWAKPDHLQKPVGRLEKKS